MQAPNGDNAELAPREPDRRLTPAAPDDAAAMSRMAWRIWLRHYHPEILSLPAIRHLWDRAYRPDLIASDIERGTAYRWIEQACRRVGFVAWRPDAVQPRLWLSKLYVVPEYHGIGLGAYALEQAEHAARERALSEIRLYVFKKNALAIRAYLRAGFHIAHEEISDAGDGFVYDDYVMSKRVAADQSYDASPSPAVR